MDIATIYIVTGSILFCLGMVALILRTNTIHRLIAINVMGVGVFMWFISAAYDPIIPDSVPHALVLTGIVVAVSATAFALALLVRIEKNKGAEK